MMEDKMLLDITQAGTTAQANQMATLDSTFHNSFFFGRGRGLLK
jgi:hypothetical protein